jgi:hypothetical protein
MSIPPPPPPPTIKYSTFVSKAIVALPINAILLEIDVTARPSNSVVLLANEISPVPADELW